MTQILFARQYAQSPGNPEWSRERLLNCYVEAWPQDAPAPALIKQTPGLTAFADLDAGGHVRAMKLHAGEVYTVAGGALFKVSSDGSSSRLGDVVDDVYTTIAANDANQIAVVAGGRYFVWDGEEIAEPLVPDLTGALSVIDINGYMLVCDTSGDRYQFSGVNDAKTFRLLDYSSADAKPDGLVGARAYLSYAWIFGSETIEIHRATGAPDEPFRRFGGGVIERGCLTAQSISSDDQSVFWIGDDRQVYRSISSQPQVISTPAVSGVLDDYPVGANIRGMTFTREGHKSYALAFDDRPALVYDISMGLWHERNSSIEDDAPWVGQCSVSAFGEELIGGDDGVIYRLDPSAYLDGARNVLRLGESQTIMDGDRRFSLARIALNIKTGYADIDREPRMALQLSRNGQIWTPEKWRGLGHVGDYSKVVSWRGLGQARRFQARFRYTDPTPLALYGALYEAT